MSGRDPDEEHRSATPLELLYDLTFVVAFGVAAEQFAHLLAAGHLASGLIGFSFAVFGICWAWINFSWFASAYDTDDWVFRLAVMVQMVGVIILALGLPPVFHSIDTGDPINNRVAVLGYVVMRVAMLFLWLRAARQDPPRRRACQTYAATIGIAQAGWVLLLLTEMDTATFFLVATPLILIELAGPVIAERGKGGTPWHAGHIAERYGLLTIITLGEGVIGTVASLNAVVESDGWSGDAALVAIAGIGLTFGLWWTYFMVPSAEVLRVHRERVFAWGYGHMLIFGSIAATGAGLQVAAAYISNQAQIGATGTVLTVAVPVAVYVFTLYGLYTILLRTADPFHLTLLAGTVAVLVLGTVLAGAGVPMAACLVVLTFAPLVTVIGYETIGHQHMRLALERTGVS
ncbi:MAG TPA: low temperature requirement protein A [Actinomycetes bacterium]|nr:low temperature requirement protein A [Actinomycetes bacterium]